MEDGCVQEVAKKGAPYENGLPVMAIDKEIVEKSCVFVLTWVSVGKYKQ